MSEFVFESHNKLVSSWANGLFRAKAEQPGGLPQADIVVTHIKYALESILGPKELITTFRP